MLIAIAGPAGAGKDTLGALMARELGGRACIMKFAAPVKRLCGEIFGWDSHQMESQELKNVADPRWGLSPREVLQRFGTDVCRSIHPNVWVEYAIRTAKQKVNHPEKVAIGGSWVNRVIDHCIFTDCRFVNEAQAVIAEGGIVVWKQPSTPSKSQHPSELEMHSDEFQELVTRRVGWYTEMSVLETAAKALTENEIWR